MQNSEPDDRVRDLELFDHVVDMKAHSCYSSFVHPLCECRTMIVTQLTSLAASFLLCIGVTIPIGGLAAAEPQYERFHIKWVEKGSFFYKTIIELGTDEGKAALQAACNAFRTDCSILAEALGTYRYLSRHKGNEHHDNIMSPEGWEVCDLNYTTGVSPESFLSITYRHDDTISFVPNGNGPDGISLYFAVPQNEKEGHWIDTYLNVMYVPAGERSNYNCLQLNEIGRTDIRILTCKGAHNAQPRGIKNCG